MAGAVRQPIDLKAFQKYIEEHVPEIKTPIDLKQVGCSLRIVLGSIANDGAVWLWSIESHLPDNGRRWPTICHAKEASGEALV